MTNHKAFIVFMCMVCSIIAISAHATMRELPQARQPDFWPGNIQPPFSAAINPDSPGVIQVCNASFDPLVKMPEIPGELVLKSASDTQFHIVQFTGPISPEDKEQIRAAGAEPVHYRAHFAFICHVSDTRNLEKIRDLPMVRWVGPWEPAYRIDHEVGRTPLASLERLNDTKYSLIVTLFQESDIRNVQEEIIALGGTLTDKVVLPHRVSLHISLDPSAIPSLAHIEGIYRIEEEPEFFVMNDETQEVIQSGSLAGGTPLWSHGLTGSDQIIGVMDSGLDPDHCFFYDSSQSLPSSTVNNSHRKIIAYRTYGGTTWDECDMGHGTHVCGTAAGYPDDGSSNLAYQGIAYDAKITFGDVGRSAGCSTGALYVPTSLTQTFTDTMSDGGYIHTNSWGSTSNTYSSYCTDVDDYMWNNKDFLVLFAAGNSGDGAGTVGYPGTAKNLICVGGSDNVPNIEDMYEGSSRGPVSTSNRMAPTLTAPAIDTSENPDGLHSADNTTGATGRTCGIAVDYWYGTSMACPAVAGMAALVRQYFMEGFYPGGTANAANAFTPSAALMKATLINGATNMTGDPADRPSNDQGWGRILMDDTLFFDGDSENLIVHDETSGVTHGNTDTWNITVANTGLPVKITLVWTDQSGNSLVNDLDLVLTGNGSTYYGNNFTGGWSNTGTTRDRTNPAECIFLSAGTLATGSYTIEVQGYNIPQGEGASSNRQPYALVISGGIGPLGTPTPTPTGPTPTFTPSPTPTDTPTCGTYSYWLMDNDCTAGSSNFYTCDPDSVGTDYSNECPTDCSPGDDCVVGWDWGTGDTGLHWQYYYTGAILLDCTEDVQFDMCYGLDGFQTNLQGDFYVYYRCADSGLELDCTTMGSSGVSGGDWTLAWSDVGVDWTENCSSRTVSGEAFTVPCTCRYIQVMVAVNFDAYADYYGIGYFHLYYDSCVGNQCSTGQRTCDGDPVGSCPANSIFSQPSEFLSGSAYTSDDDASYAAAESFTGLTDNITGIRWWGIDFYNDGSSWYNCDLGTMDFTITFYNDSSGLPGSVVTSETVTATRTDTGYYFASDRIYEYTASITPVSLASGWVAVTGASGDTCWLLETGTDSGDNIHGSYDGSTWSSAAGDVGFCLISATAATATPTYTPMPPTNTPTYTQIPPTNTPIPTDTPIPTNTPTDTPTNTPIPTDTPEPTATPTDVPTNTPIPTDTPIPTNTPTDTPTNTPIPTDTPVPTIPAIVINEVYYDDPSTDEESYVEIYGPAGTSLDGVTLQPRNQGCTDQTSVDLTGYTIPADGYFVVGMTGVANVDLVDASLGSSLQNGPCDSVWLVFNAVDVDGVRYGDDCTSQPTSCGEGSPVPEPDTSRSISRSIDGVDTDDNLADFCESNLTPGEANDCFVPTPTPTDTPIPTETPTPIPTDTPVPTETPTPIPTDTPIPTNTPTDTPTNTPIPTDTPEPTATPTDVPTNTPIPTETPTPIPTDTPVPTETPTPIPTDTPIPTNTPIPTETPTPIPTNTPVPTNTPTDTPTNTPIPTDTPVPTIPAIVINEVYYDDPSTDEESYVEIYGPAGTSLDGVTLQPRNQTCTDQTSVDLTGYTIPADGYFVVGMTGVANVDLVDASLGSSLQNGPCDSVWLVFNAVDVDGVRYGDDCTSQPTSCGEGSPVPEPDTSRSISRSIDGVDTDDNLADFCESNLTPGEANDCFVPTPTPTDTPIPTETPTPIPTDTPVPTETPTPIPTDTPIPTNTPIPTDTPEPTATPTDVPTNTPIPTETPTPIPTDTPVPTETPTPIPTDTPVPTNTPTYTPVPTDTPVLTATPTSTPRPIPTTDSRGVSLLLIVISGLILFTGIRKR